MRYITKKDLHWKKHDPDSHKGENGRVLIVGGSRDYVGALAIAGIAALRAGADTVTIAAPEKVAWTINCISKDLMTVKLAGDFISMKHIAEIKRLEDKNDILLIGNGAGLKKETRAAIRKIVKGVTIPMVVDADGIKAVAIQEVENAILTPHKKEFEILCKNSGLPNNIAALQKHLRNNVIVIKGRIDLIVSSKRIAYNKTGNEGMTKGGTGDCLAGLCAGLLGQKYEPFAAASMAAFVNGSIGDLEKKKRGYSFIASDMLEDIQRMTRTA